MGSSVIFQAVARGLWPSKYPRGWVAAAVIVGGEGTSGGRSPSHPWQLPMPIWEPRAQRYRRVGPAGNKVHWISDAQRSGFSRRGWGAVRLIPDHLPPPLAHRAEGVGGNGPAVASTEQFLLGAGRTCGFWNSKQAPPSLCTSWSEGTRDRKLVALTTPPLLLLRSSQPASTAATLASTPVNPRLL